MKIGLEKAKQMMRAPKHKGTQTALHPTTRRYRVDNLYIHVSRLAGKWYVDCISAGTTSLAQNATAFFYSDETFTKVYPSEYKQQMPANISLNDFCNSVGNPENHKSDWTQISVGRTLNS